MKYQKTLAALATTSIIAIGLVAYGAGDKAEEKKDKDAKKDSKKDEMATKKASDVPNTVKNPQEGEVIVKCAGIVKKGKNHCGANGHDCNGLSAKDPKIKDFDPNEWIYVRKEVCDATAGKIVGQVKIKG